MIAIERISPPHAMRLKATRLRALLDSPSAFGSTYARESAFTDEQWAKKAEQWSNGTTSCGCLAIEDREACGIAAGYFEPGNLIRANLVSMWVAPSHRRRNVGRMLVDAVVDWARLRNAKIVRLDVVNINAGAVKFYETIGFTKTGVTKPYPNDPALIEYELAMPL